MILIISFLTGFALMVTELTASRIMAPLIGSSVFMWTSVIGTVMLGLSVGNFIGGYHIDKIFSKKVVASYFVISAFFIACIPYLSRHSEWIVLMDLGLFSKVFFLSLYLFLLPSVSIGSIYPSLVKFHSHNNSEIGKKSGQVSAFWSFGSILGTFMTGFYLIGSYGSSDTLYLMSAMLLACSFAIYFHSEKKYFLTYLVIFFLIIQFSNFQIKSISNDNIIDIAESNYYTIKVADARGLGLVRSKALVLDFDIHSLEGPYVSHSYPYIYKVFKHLNPEISDIASIGGGSSLAARKMADYFEGSRVSSIEIDPVVVEMANKHFSKSSNKVDYIISDGRVFLASKEDLYDVIFLDVYSSLVSMPWHMTTAEFARTVGSALRPEGLFAMNIISSLEGPSSGVFNSIYKTFSTSFERFYVFNFSSNKSELGNIILIGTNAKNAPDTEYFRQMLENDRESSYYSSLLVADYRIEDGSVQILTDDYAPIEKISMPMLDLHFREYAETYYDNFY